MLNKTKFYPLTLAVGLIFLNFRYFEDLLLFRILGRVLIVLSIILFFVKYYPRRKDKERT